MKIYFVRHGETSGNLARRHQIEGTRLTPEGKQQAIHIAKELKKYQPTHLLTSTLVRAVETAREIGEVCDLVPETSQSFVELSRPDNLYGHYHKSFYTILFYVRWYLGLVKSGDGETYRALRDRFLVARSELMQYPDDARVVVVSHAAFLNLFIAHLCRRKPLLPHQIFGVFMNILNMKNGQSIEVEFDGAAPAGQCPWQAVDRQLETS